MVIKGIKWAIVSRAYKLRIQKPRRIKSLQYPCTSVSLWLWTWPFLIPFPTDTVIQRGVYVCQNSYNSDRHSNPMRRTCVRKLQFQMGYAITITVPTILLQLWYNFDQVQHHVANCPYTAKTIKLVVLTTEWLPWLLTNWRQRSLLWYGRLTR